MITANVPVQMRMLLVTSAIVVLTDFMDFQIVPKVDVYVKFFWWKTCSNFGLQLVFKKLEYIQLQNFFQKYSFKEIFLQYSGCDNVWSCCSSASPCNDEQGDCDTNDDCIGDLVCGISNCIGSKYPPNVDCCTSESKGTKLALSNLVG